MIFIFSCDSCHKKLLAGSFQDLFDSLNLQSWKRNSKVVMGHHLLVGSLLSLSWLSICLLGKSLWFYFVFSFRTNQLCFSYPSAMAVRRDFCGNDSHPWSLEFPKKLLKNASFLILQWWKNDHFWIAQNEKNMGAFLKGAPKWKECVSPCKMVCVCQFFQPCNGLEKIFYVGVRGGGKKEWERERRK